MSYSKEYYLKNKDKLNSKKKVQRSVYRTYLNDRERARVAYRKAAIIRAMNTDDPESLFYQSRSD